MHKQNKNFNLFIEKISAPNIIISSFLSFMFVMVLVNVVFRQNYSYLTQTFNYTSTYVYQLLYDIGSAGRNSHLLVFIPDILMILLYTIFLVGANYAIFNRLVESCLVISIITFSPLILSITQFTEIAMLIVILLQYPNQLHALAQFVNVISMIKTILTVIFFLTPLLGLCTLGIKKLIKQV